MSLFFFEILNLGNGLSYRVMFYIKRSGFTRATIYLVYTLGVSRRLRAPGDKTRLGRFNSHVKEASDVESPEVKVVGNIGLWYRKL